MSIYQTFQISPGTPIPWMENLKPAVRALLITPSYATGCKEGETLEIMNIVLYMIILKLKISIYIFFFKLYSITVINV